MNAVFWTLQGWNFCLHWNNSENNRTRIRPETIIRFQKPHSKKLLVKNNISWINPLGLKFVRFLKHFQILFNKVLIWGCNERNHISLFITFVRWFITDPGISKFSKKMIFNLFFKLYKAIEKMWIYICF